MLFMLKFPRATHLGIKTMGWHLKQAAFWAREEKKPKLWHFWWLLLRETNGLLGMWGIEYSVLQTAQINRTRWKVLMQHEQSYLRVFLKVYWALPENTGAISVFIWSLWKTIEGFLFFFNFLFILFIWVIYEFPFVWNGGFILKLNRNFCQTLLFGADSHSCDVVLTHFKMIMFWLDRSNAVESVRQAGGRAFKLQNLKLGVWEDCLQRVGCHRLVLCDL